MIKAIIQFSLRAIALISLLLSLAVPTSIFAAEPMQASVLNQDPGSELWRNVRQRDGAIAGSSQMKQTGSGVLINISGEAWRQYRMLSLIPKAGIILLVALIGVLLFRLIRGKIKLENGFSGEKVLRFTLNQRVAHWATAILFIILALTGLVLLLGRNFLIPVLGAETFSYIAVTAKALHDYLGPAFAVSLLFLLFLFIRGNQPNFRLDLNWLKSGGGLFGQHASADRYNAGEKGWFWLAIIVGGTIVISGLVLDFPIFDQTRATMEFYHVIHSIAAIILIAASFGHIYMGTAAMEGTFEVMKTGQCDKNWAKEHHDLWYEKVSANPENEVTSNTESGLNDAAADVQKSS